MNIAFPLYFDGYGRTAVANDNDHITQMIEQLIFTNSGERVNRPDFGGNLLQLIFAPNSPELAAALQFTLQAALQRWLGDVIAVNQLQVEANDATLNVVVNYTVRSTNATQVAQFERTV